MRHIATSNGDHARVIIDAQRKRKFTKNIVGVKNLRSALNKADSKVIRI